MPYPNHQPDLSEEQKKRFKDFCDMLTTYNPPTVEAMEELFEKKEGK